MDLRELRDGYALFTTKRRANQDPLDEPTSFRDQHVARREENLGSECLLLRDSVDESIPHGVWGDFATDGLRFPRCAAAGLVQHEI